MLEIRLLGPLDVRDGEREIAVPRQKQRAVLAVLALNVGHVLAKDRLVDLLWGDHAPAGAAHALENYVSQLRKLLGPSVIVTRPPGYVLDVGPEQVDVVRFERLVAEARGASEEERAAKLEEALALHRGPPLADLAYEPFARAETARLEELELSAREELIEARLELGRHAEVILELERLIGGNPYRERLRALLMLALYRSGRQAEALAAYQQARDALVEGLGIDPGEELQELERSILRQDTSLRAPAVTGTPRSPSPATRPSRKTVTVLVALPTGERGLDPEALGEVLDRYQAAARTIVERHGGRVERSLGDAVVAVFGVPAAREDDALRAIGAASDLTADLPVRVGVSTGEVFVRGETGESVIGDPVSEAGRLARAAEPGEVLLGEQTQRLTRERGLRLDSPLVGRTRQLAALADAFATVVEDRTCQLFTLLGAAGVGKSRLLEEFLGRLGDDATVLRGRCLSYGEGIAFAPLVEAICGAAGLDRLSEPEGSPIDSLVFSREDAVTIEARRAEALRMIETGAAADELFRAARSLVEGLAARRSLVVVFDDLHWADPSFLDLVEDVAERSRGVPVLIVCSTRPELLDERPTWGGGKANSRSILLEPLGDEESEQLMDNLLGESDLAPIVRRYIVDAAEGNPLFMEELLSSLVDRAVLRREGGAWTTRELPALAMPPSIQALLAARIDRLPDDQRLVLELAAVEGRRFHGEAVAELAPDGLRDEVGSLLGALVQRDLILPRRGRERSFAFRHQLLRDAAYDSIPKQTRADLHERFAVWLEHRAGSRAAEIEEILHYHGEQATRLRDELLERG